MNDRASQSFDLLDERIRRWIWQAGWGELRVVQEMAIPPIVAGGKDVIVAASTASGKTEAAFLPILTSMLADERGTGLAVYISPLKALINDQFARLGQLCEALDIPVHGWHGDVNASQKNRFVSNPQGILLITPESLEAMLCGKGMSTAALFKETRFFVIDELHAFIGSERGKQLQSLLHRLDVLTSRKAPRIGLSATLGDMSLACEFLRPGRGKDVVVVEAPAGRGELHILVKGYVEKLVVKEAQPLGDEDMSQEIVADAEKPAKKDPEPLAEGEDEEEDPHVASIAQALFRSLRGSNNLVFPNTRRDVERYSAQLRNICAREKIPNEFWPHHGSLSKDIREETERAVKATETPATAICTNTLELGIDIGPIKSVAQIGPPPSVASLRQRLGRSGRREGEPAILRGYIVEPELGPKSHLADQLRLNLFETAAMITLLLDKWCEPPRTQGLHMSTLVQQILALIAERSGVTAAQAYAILCSTGPFSSVSRDEFIALLKHLGSLDLLIQDSGGTLLHGKKGEAKVNHYTFYAAFATEDEYRVVSGGKTLGSVPVKSALRIHDMVLFAGRNWRVLEIDPERKIIVVSRTKRGKAPNFGGARGYVHDVVRKRMRFLYESTEVPTFLDSQAVKFLEEGRAAYAIHNLANETVVQNGGDTLVFTWLGDASNEAISMMLKDRGMSSMVLGPYINVKGNEDGRDGIKKLLEAFAHEPVPTPAQLLESSETLEQERWDWALPEDLLQKSFASLKLDIGGGHAWLADHFKVGVPGASTRTSGAAAS